MNNKNAFIWGGVFQPVNSFHKYAHACGLVGCFRQEVTCPMSSE